MLKGEQLFNGATVSDTLAAVLKEDPDLTRVPAEVRRLFQACLQKDPRQRLQAIGDWRLLLDHAQPAAPVRAKRLPWAITTAALILAVAAGWNWLRRSPAPDSRTYNLEIVPPDGEALYQAARSGFEAISPDGRTIAFMAESKDTRHIWLRPLDSLVARPLPGTEFATGLFWSPDSRHLGFMAVSRLLRVEIATGAIKEICDVGRDVRGASWSASGTIIFGAPGTEIRRVSADGGIPARVTAVERDRESQHNFPQFLPDGKHFLYFILGVNTPASGIYIVSLDAAPEKQGRNQILATPYVALYAQTPGGSSGHLLFLRGKTLFAQPFDPNHLLLNGAPRAIAENVGARSLHAEFSVSQTGILAFSTAGNVYRSVTVASRDGTTIETLGKPDAYDSLRLSQMDATSHWSFEAHRLWRSG
jgi:hypothetical protein